jgi:hypothetical protein
MTEEENAFDPEQFVRQWVAHGGCADGSGLRIYADASEEDRAKLQRMVLEARGANLAAAQAWAKRNNPLFRLEPMGRKWEVR